MQEIATHFRTALDKGSHGEHFQRLHQPSSSSKTTSVVNRSRVKGLRISKFSAQVLYLDPPM